MQLAGFHLILHLNQKRWKVEIRAAQFGVQRWALYEFRQVKASSGASTDELCSESSKIQFYGIEVMMPSDQ